MKILLDTNIILDLALTRQPYFEHAKRIFNLGGTNQWELYVTSVSVTDIHYIASRIAGKAASLKFLKDLVLAVNFSISNKQVIQSAIYSSFKDFEDAVQYYSALSSNLEVIITRNKKDFKPARKIEVLTPGEFLKKYIQP